MITLILATLAIGLTVIALVLDSPKPAYVAIICLAAIPLLGRVL